MNGAKESRGKHRVKIERGKELLDLETEIQRCIYRDRVKGGKEKAGRKSLSVGRYRHDNTDETVQPQHVCMHIYCTIIHNTVYACYMRILLFFSI